MKQAEQFWVQDAQIDLEDPLTNGDFKKLNVYKDELEIIVVGNHVEKWVEVSYDKRNLSFLLKDRRFAICL